MLKILSAISLSFLFSSLTWATVPEDLMIKSYPVDPLCFFNLQSTAKTINLEHCGLNKHKFIIKGQNRNLIQKGFIGYDIQSSDTSGRTGYSYYKLFNAGPHQYWIYTVNNGGGTGDFTAIQLIKRKNANQLSTKNIAGGDRCNGGVRDVSEKNNQLSYSINLTAYDLISFSENVSSPNQAYSDLADCAVCCVAKAVYTVNANKPSELQYIDLGNVQNVKTMPQQGKRQACFNNLFVSYVKSGKTKLQKTELDTLVKKFNQRCLERN